MKCYLSGWQATNKERESAVLKSGAITHRCFSFAMLRKLKGLPYYIPGLDGAYQANLKHKVGIMMDSGVFSYRTYKNFLIKSKKGTEKLVDEESFIRLYVDFVKENWKLWDFPMTIDLQPEAAANFERHFRIEAMGVKLVPAFHGDASVDFLKRYSDKGHKLIAVGSPKKLRTKKDQIRQYLDACFNVASKCGVELHGLALTAPWQILDFPWWSVDSLKGDTSFVVIRQAGRVRIDSMEELFWSVPGPVLIDSDGHSKKEAWNLEVLSVDANGNSIWKKLRYVIRHNVFKKITRVQAYRGATVDITYDHSIMTTVSNRFKPRPSTVEQIDETNRLISSWALPAVDTNVEGLESLTVDIPHLIYKTKRVGQGFGGTTVGTRLLPICIDLDTEFLEFIGLWLADGSYGERGGINMSVGIDDECVNLVKRIRNRFGAVSDVIKINSNRVDVRMSNVRLASAMRALGITGDSHTKELPWWVFRLSSRQRCALLRGFFSGDGGAPATYSTVSNKLFYGLLLLLQTEGIFASQTPFFRLTRKFGGFSKPNDKRTGGVAIVSSKEYVRVFADKIGFIQTRKNKATQEWLVKDRTNKRNNKGQMIGMSFVSLMFKKTDQGYYRGWVYDLNVPGQDYFLANGLLVHNSSSWSRTAGYGVIMRYDENRHRFSMLHVSDQASASKGAESKLNTSVMKRIQKELEDEGYDFHALQTDFVQRHIYNARTMQKLAAAADRKRTGWNLLV